MRLSVVVALLTLLSLGGQAHAQVSDGVVRIGVLSDESGPYATLAGPGSRVAAMLAELSVAKPFGGAASHSFTKARSVESVMEA